MGHIFKEMQANCKFITLSSHLSQVSSNKIHKNHIGMFLDSLQGEAKIIANRISNNTANQFPAISVIHTNADVIIKDNL